MDRIIEAYLNDFRKEYNFSENLEQSKLFEYFVNYCIISRLYPERFPLEDISVGGGGDMALDGVAIIVNDNLVFSPEEVDDLKAKLHRLDVKFIFIQSKSGNKFDVAKIGNFLFGVESFFDKETSGYINEDIQNLRYLKEYIYDLSIDMSHNPICEMYYVTTGKWENDSNLRKRINAGEKTLRKTDLFDESENGVKFVPVDAEYLKIIYKEIRNKVDKKINFDKHTILPKIDKVDEAYIGILPATEYLKLICANDGTLLRNLFNDNVRDFQGNNPVNQEITDTINDEGRRGGFVLFNNGITIVAKSILKTGSDFTIRDFQIVNGCQTSHILYNNKESLDNNVFLPLKIIVTSDEEVTNRIIKATNRQTEVKQEAFLSLLPFQKYLEEFYASFTGNSRLYYERRSKQYDNQTPAIDKSKIVSITIQIRCFMSMFLCEPHSTHRYYGELYETNSKKIFVEGHSYYPYYISCYALYSLDNLFKYKKVDSSYKRWYKYHLLMIFRLIATKNINFTQINRKKLDNYCAELQKIIQNEEELIKIFKQAISIIDVALIEFKNKKYTDGQLSRRKFFTDKLINLAEQEHQKVTLE
ncbi:AIPR family protein [Halotia branconii]|uniref:AIPR family protein n=1 Tax=Halotia branconii CENA392 TaxID=1539056 RepID=A0AAJ6NQ15_9CYAN|nr:AIPR family protein [Halotia branconii]WGV24604.1 AIPR family protein [Halotia branconii CENA392]